MAVDLDKLTKILRLEAEDGYLDRKVVKGLATFIGNWITNALKSSPTPLEARLIERVSERLTDYAGFSPVVRATAIEDVLNASAFVAARRKSGVRSQESGVRKEAVVSGQWSVVREEQARSQKPEVRSQNIVIEEKQAPVAVAVANQVKSSLISSAADVSPISDASYKNGSNKPSPNPKSPVPPSGVKIQNPKLTSNPKSLDPALLTEPLSKVKGIGETYAKLMGFLNLATIEQALYHFPFRHEDFSNVKKINQLLYGRTESVLVKVLDVQNIRLGRSGKEMVEVTFGDETGSIKAIYFSRKQVYNLKPGAEVMVSGKIDSSNGRPTFRSPSHEPADKDLIHTGRLVPVYHTTGPLSVLRLRSLLKKCVDGYVGAVPEHLPEAIRERQKLIELPLAIRDYHFPPDNYALERARRRLAFDEFFMIQLGVLAKRREWQEERPAPALPSDPALLDSWYANMPFALTGDQSRATDDILADIARPKPMRRLVQGDVGSGKTVVAATALLVTVANGYQGVMMAPTQILAEQHYKSLSRMYAPLTLPANELFPKEREQDGFTPSPQGEVWGEGKKPLIATNPTLLPLKNEETRGIRVALLSGSVKKKDKEQIYRQIAAGEIDVVVGTHAVIQEGVQFAQLGLVITDEQHRFGVIQRSNLRDKGQETNPHVLTMTATPIPRSLNLTLYGDLDISLIREMPPGRKPIRTKWVLPDDREKAYDFIREQIKKGRQAFIICPLVEESDKIEAKAAVDEHARLQSEVYPDLKLGLLHGRMKPSEKDQIMHDFREVKFDILVATSVIEVGIDIPNASVILIEGADRFGLSQLHQFRGRVGRGEHASYCLLLGSDDLSEEGQKRLKIIEDTSDGFILAEEDLKLRGPGEFFGTRQSGVPNLQVAGLYDTPLLETAREEATQLFAVDPELHQHPLLLQKISRFWSTEGDLS